MPEIVIKARNEGFEDTERKIERLEDAEKKLAKAYSDRMAKIETFKRSLEKAIKQVNDLFKAEERLLEGDSARVGFLKSTESMENDINRSAEKRIQIIKTLVRQYKNLEKSIDRTQQKIVSYSGTSGNDASAKQLQSLSEAKTKIYKDLSSALSKMPGIGEHESLLKLLTAEKTTIKKTTEETHKQLAATEKLEQLKKKLSDKRAIRKERMIGIPEEEFALMEEEKLEQFRERIAEKRLNRSKRISESQESIAAEARKKEEQFRERMAEKRLNRLKRISESQELIAAEARKKEEQLEQWRASATERRLKRTQRISRMQREMLPYLRSEGEQVEKITEKWKEKEGLLDRENAQMKILESNYKKTKKQMESLDKAENDLKNKKIDTYSTTEAQIKANQKREKQINDIYKARERIVSRMKSELKTISQGISQKERSIVDGGTRAQPIEKATAVQSIGEMQQRISKADAAINELTGKQKDLLETEKKINTERTNAVEKIDEQKKAVQESTKTTAKQWKTIEDVEAAWDACGNGVDQYSQKQNKLKKLSSVVPYRIYKERADDLERVNKALDLSIAKMDQEEKGYKSLSKEQKSLIQEEKRLNDLASKRVDMMERLKWLTKEAEAKGYPGLRNEAAEMLSEMDVLDRRNFKGDVGLKESEKATKDFERRIKSLDRTVRSANRSTSIFTGMWGNFAVSMSGIAATLFVFQQIAQTMKQMLDYLREIETVSASLKTRYEGGFGKDLAEFIENKITGTSYSRTDIVSVAEALDSLTRNPVKIQKYFEDTMALMKYEKISAEQAAKEAIGRYNEEAIQRARQFLDKTNELISNKIDQTLNRSKGQWLGLSRFIGKMFTRKEVMQDDYTMDFGHVIKTPGAKLTDNKKGDLTESDELYLKTLEKMKAQKGIYEELGRMGNEYFDRERDDITITANLWRDAGHEMQALWYETYMLRKLYNEKNISDATDLNKIQLANQSKYFASMKIMTEGLYKHRRLQINATFAEETALAEETSDEYILASKKRDNALRKLEQDRMAYTVSVWQKIEQQTGLVVNDFYKYRKEQIAEDINDILAGIDAQFQMEKARLHESLTGRSIVGEEIIVGFDLSAWNEKLDALTKKYKALKDVIKDLYYQHVELKEDLAFLPGSNDFSFGWKTAAKEIKLTLKSNAELAYDFAKNTISKIESMFSNAMDSLFSSEATNPDKAMNSFISSFAAMIGKTLVDAGKENAEEIGKALIKFFTKREAKGSGGTWMSSIGMLLGSYALNDASTGRGPSWGGAGAAAGAGAIFGGSLAAGGGAGVAYMAYSTYQQQQADMKKRDIFYKIVKEHLKSIEESLSATLKSITRQLDPNYQQTQWTESFYSAGETFRETIEELYNKEGNTQKYGRWQDIDFVNADPMEVMDRLDLRPRDIGKFQKALRLYMDAVEVMVKSNRVVINDIIDNVESTLEQYGPDKTSFETAVNDFKTDIEELATAAGEALDADILARETLAPLQEQLNYWKNLSPEDLLNRNSDQFWQTHTGGKNGIELETPVFDTRAWNHAIKDAEELINGMVETLSGDVSAIEGDLLSDEDIQRLTEISGMNFENLEEFQILLEKFADIRTGVLEDAERYVGELTGELSEMDLAIMDINDKFDAWQDTLLDSGASVKELTALEELRVKALGVTIEEIERAEKGLLSLQEVLSGFESLQQRVQSKIMDNWDLDKLFEEYSSVTSAIDKLDENSERYWDDALDLFSQQIDYLEKIESMAEEQLEEYKATRKNISDMITELEGGNMAASQSIEWMQNRYDTLKAGATDAEGVSAFTGFLQEYLDFANAYGLDYADLTAAAIDDLKKIDKDFLTKEQELLNLIQQNTGGTKFSVDRFLEDNVFWLEEIWNILNDKLTEMIEELGGHENEEDTPGSPGSNTTPEYTSSNPASIKPSSATSYMSSTGFKAALDLLSSDVNAAKAIDHIYNAAAGALNYNHLKIQMATAISREMTDKMEWEGFDGNMHGFKLTFSPFTAAPPGHKGESYLSNIDYWAAGGLATRPGIIGEKGAEWAVPTYEPERSRFLSDVGVDPDRIGASIAKHLAPLIVQSADGKNIQVVVSESAINHGVARGMSRDPKLIKATRKAAGRR